MTTLENRLSPTVAMALLAIDLCASGAVPYSSFADNALQVDFRRDGRDLRIEAIGDSAEIDELSWRLSKMHGTVTVARNNPNFARIEIYLPECAA